MGFLTHFHPALTRLRGLDAQCLTREDWQGATPVHVLMSNELIDDLKVLYSGTFPFYINMAEEFHPKRF